MRQWMNLFESEAEPDEVADVVEEFVAIVEKAGVCNEVYHEHQGEYVHLFLGGYAEDGFGEKKGREIASELNALVRPMGWFVAKCDFRLYDEHFGESDPEGGTSQIMCFIDVFPLFGVQDHHVPRVLYHVCRPSDVESIMATGLEPRQGGNDHIQTENGRIYAVRDYRYLDNIEEDFKKLRKWIDLQVIAIDTSGLNNPWFKDVEMLECSVWTPEAIPAHALRHIGKL